MQDFTSRNFPVLAKVWEDDKITNEQLVQAGQEIVKFIYPYLKFKYPQLNSLRGQSGETLKVVGAVALPVIAPRPSLADAVKERYGIDFSEEKYIPISIPRDILGSNTYVVFEIPSPQEEVIPEKTPIKLNPELFQKAKDQQNS